MVYLWMLSHKRFTELWHPCYEDSYVVAIQSFFEELPKRSPGPERRESLLQFFGAALRLDEQRGTSLNILAESLTSDGYERRIIDGTSLLVLANRGTTPKFTGAIENATCLAPVMLNGLYLTVGSVPTPTACSKCPCTLLFDDVLETNVRALYVKFALH
ncbi:unnamed protein product [Fusarium graminearum]|nr:unnamed protein product [Fusarium graminearum]